MKAMDDLEEQQHVLSSMKEKILEVAGAEEFFLK